jgi:Ran GTPase-activating protein (RanGAP) involved in mRNA processing and transport
MEAYLQAVDENNTSPLPPVLHLGRGSALDVSSNTLPIQQLKRRVGDADIKALSVMLPTSSITAFIANYGDMTDAGAEVLAAALPSSLQHLSLASNSLAAAGVKAIVEAAKKLPSLTSLVLDSNALGKEGGAVLADLVASHSCLEVLSAARCELDTDAVLFLCTALAKTTSLRSLDISEPLLFSRNEETAYHVSKALRCNSSLEHLSLRKAPFVVDSGLEAICEYLLDNSSLRSLDLTACRIGPPGGVTLARTLAAGARLHSLNLSHCRVADQGAVALAAVLRDGATNLVDLDLRNNDIKDEGLVALAEALVSPSCPLQRLQVFGNHLQAGSEGCTAVAAAVTHLQASMSPLQIDCEVYEVDGVLHIGKMKL